MELLSLEIDAEFWWYAGTFNDPPNILDDALLQFYLQSSIFFLTYELSITSWNLPYKQTKKTLN